MSIAVFTRIQVTKKGRGPGLATGVTTSKSFGWFGWCFLIHKLRKGVNVCPRFPELQVWFIEEVPTAISLSTNTPWNEGHCSGKDQELHWA